MATKSRSKLTYLTSLLLITAFILSSCASQVFSKEIENKEEPSTEESDDFITEETTDEETNEEITENTIDFITIEQAREIAVAYLREKYDLEAPVEWLKNDQAPEGLLGASKYLYTSGAWVVTISAPVVAPQYLLYSIEIDHIQSGLHWEGKVDAQGTLTELTISEPLKVLSIEDARDTVVNFLTENYQWAGLMDWNEADRQPAENASLCITFTSGPWVIQVKFFAAAPFVPEYTIVADHLTLNARWTGIVKSNGDIVEEAYVTN